MYKYSYFYFYIDNPKTINIEMIKLAVVTMVFSRRDRSDQMVPIEAVCSGLALFALPSALSKAYGQAKFFKF